MAAKPWNVVNLVLPVGDKEYVIEPIDYRAGLTLLATQAKDPQKGLDLGDDGESLYRHCMGPAWDQMIKDKCPHPVVDRASLAAIHYQTALVQGADCATAVAIAENVWENGLDLDPEALAAFMAAIERESTATPAPKKTSTRSTSTAAAAKTPSRASGSGTRSPRATPPSKSSAAPAKPRRSTGRPSSTAGRSS